MVLNNQKENERKTGVYTLLLLIYQIFLDCLICFYAFLYIYMCVNEKRIIGLLCPSVFHCV